MDSAESLSQLAKLCRFFIVPLIIFAPNVKPPIFRNSNKIVSSRYTFKTYLCFSRNKYLCLFFAANIERTLLRQKIIMVDSWSDLLYLFLLQTFDFHGVSVYLCFVPLVPFEIIDRFRLSLQKDIAIIHKQSRTFLLDVDFGGVELSLNDLFSIKFHDPSWAIGRNNNDDVVSRCRINYSGSKMVDLVECTLIIANQSAWAFLQQ